MTAHTAGEWVGGLAVKLDEERREALLSIAFTYLLPEAARRAIYYDRLGYTVRAGGPALFWRKNYLPDFVQTGGELRDAVSLHNPSATKFSDGCDQHCDFCGVWMIRGRNAGFDLYPDAPVRPVLCDNNLSGLQVEFQNHIIDRYQREGVPLLDANSGFEPKSFDDDCLVRWSKINRGPWRFGFDTMSEREGVERIFKMLDRHGVAKGKRRRPYVIIGNEPFEQCMERIRLVMEWGGEPHVQPMIKLNSLERTPHVRFDWTEQLLRDVARWANSPMIWRKKARTFAEYDRSAKNPRPPRYRASDGLFV